MAAKDEKTLYVFGEQESAIPDGATPFLYRYDDEGDGSWTELTDDKDINIVGGSWASCARVTIKTDPTVVCPRDGQNPFVFNMVTEELTVMESGPLQTLHVGSVNFIHLGKLHRFVLYCKHMQECREILS